MDMNEISAFVSEGINVVDQGQEVETETFENKIDGNQDEAVPEVNPEVKPVDAPVVAVADKKPEADEALDAVKDILSPKQGVSSQIPVHVAQELREEKRQLKAENEALKAKLAEKQVVETRPDAVNSVVTDDDGLQDIEDDDVVMGSQVKAVISKKIAALEKRFDNLLSEREQKIMVAQKTSQIEQVTKDAAAKYADFGIITRKAITNQLTEQDQAVIRASVNPAETLYARCKEIDAAEAEMYKQRFGIPIKTQDDKSTNKSIPTQEEILDTPEDVFDRRFGSPDRQK